MILSHTALASCPPTSSIRRHCVCVDLIPPMPSRPLPEIGATSLRAASLAIRKTCAVMIPCSMQYAAGFTQGISCKEHHRAVLAHTATVHAILAEPSVSIIAEKSCGRHDARAGTEASHLMPHRAPGGAGVVALASMN